MTGYQSKKAMSQDKLVVTDIDGHVVRDARKPKKVALDRDAEIERLNEKIEFLSRTNMLYSDWEHRNVKVTSDLIRKGIEEAKINTELRAEIAELKTQLAQPAQEPWPEEPVGHTAGGVQPPQRTWVGLTDEEAQWLYDNCRTPSNLIDMVETMLKEKNNAA